MASAATRDARGNVLVHLEHWPSNPLTKGSYTCNQPGYFTTIADNEQKPVGNLFFAGEILDIDGITGGFNFQAAWTTSWLAGSAMHSC